MEGYANRFTGCRMRGAGCGKDLFYGIFAPRVSVCFRVLGVISCAKGVVWVSRKRLIFQAWILPANPLRRSGFGHFRAALPLVFSISWRRCRAILFHQALNPGNECIGDRGEYADKCSGCDYDAAPVFRSGSADCAIYRIFVCFDFIKNL